MITANWQIAAIVACAAIVGVVLYNKKSPSKRRR